MSGICGGGITDIRSVTTVKMLGVTVFYQTGERMAYRSLIEDSFELPSCQSCALYREGSFTVYIPRNVNIKLLHVRLPLYYIT